MQGGSSSQVDGYEIRTDRLYTKEHEWVLIKGDKAIVGITDYAQKNLHDIVYVEMPRVGSTVRQMEPMGAVESVKAVSEIFAPLSGVIVEVNRKLSESPELLNRSPYDEGWIAIIQPSNLDQEIKNLLSPEEYKRHVSSLIKK